MSHQVIWTRRTFEFFADQAQLTELERKIMETRIAGMTRVQQSLYFNISTSTLDRIIFRLKVKYDAVQAQYPDELQPRKASAAETYMDSN